MMATCPLEGDFTHHYSFGTNQGKLIDKDKNTITTLESTRFSWCTKFFSREFSLAADATNVFSSFQF